MSTAVETMTWRRLLVLVKGLSPNSATYAAMNSRVEFGSHGERVNTVTTPKAAQDAFVAAFGHMKPKT
jgi:hypothetical protein